ncbi:MAG: VapC toxin family PIN domain ribonuclease [Deltaproteobacteria bacterium HGW-Deltaproteobacteria-18]|nr:MAG: VapC toxin family PIN domain ribonuclease [Deltaproteobacteria bacterium HGW-Deltaproteobacteria-18]
MIVVDTSVWIDYFRGVAAPHTDLLDRALSESRIIIGDLILAEILQGFSSERDFQIARQLMDGLEYRDFVGRDMAMAAAQNYRALRRQGITVRKTIDVLIATFCIENGFGLIHNDRDFDPMEQLLGLRVLR